MKRRTYLLVFQENALNRGDELKPFADALDEGERLFRFDYNVAFLQSFQNVETLTERLRNGALADAYFFLADVTDTSRAGNMVPKFWDILRGQGELVAAPS